MDSQNDPYVPFFRRGLHVLYAQKRRHKSHSLHIAMELIPTLLGICPRFFLLWCFATCFPSPVTPLFSSIIMFCHRFFSFFATVFSSYFAPSVLIPLLVHTTYVAPFYYYVLPSFFFSNFATVFFAYTATVFLATVASPRFLLPFCPRFPLLVCHRFVPPLLPPFFLPFCHRIFFQLLPPFTLFPSSLTRVTKSSFGSGDYPDKLVTFSPPIDSISWGKRKSTTPQQTSLQKQDNHHQQHRVVSGDIHNRRS